MILFIATNLRYRASDLITWRRWKKLLLLVVLTKHNGVTEITIPLPDTDVSVLALGRYPLLTENTYIEKRCGQAKSRNNVKQIYEAIGPTKAKALQAFHAFTWVYRSGHIAGKGMVSLKILDKCSQKTSLGKVNKLHWRICVPAVCFWDSYYTYWRPKVAPFQQATIWSWKAFNNQISTGSNLRCHL